jgi:hypothetical protein
VPDIPTTSPLGYVGVILLLLGVFFLITGFGLIKIQNISVKPGRQTWGVGVFMILLGIASVIPDFMNRPVYEEPLSTEVTPISAPTEILDSTSIPIPTNTEMIPQGEEALSTEVTPIPAPTEILDPTSIPIPTNAEMDPLGEESVILDKTLFADGEVGCFEVVDDFSTPVGIVSLSQKGGEFEYKVQLQNAAKNWKYYVEFNHDDTCPNLHPSYGLITNENGDGVFNGRFSLPTGTYALQVDIVSDPPNNIPPNPKHREISTSELFFVDVP